MSHKSKAVNLLNGIPNALRQLSSIAGALRPHTSREQAFNDLLFADYLLAGALIHEANQRQGVESFELINQRIQIVHYERAYYVGFLELMAERIQNQLEGGFFADHFLPQSGKTQNALQAVIQAYKDSLPLANDYLIQLSIGDNEQVRASRDALMAKLDEIEEQVNQAIEISHESPKAHPTWGHMGVIKAWPAHDPQSKQSSEPEGGQAKVSDRHRRKH